MKVEFITPHRTETLDDDWHLVLEHFVYSVDGQIDFVPAGFRTNFASVPRWPLVYWIAGGRAKKSATIHDYLYEVKAGKDYADEVFYAAMVHEKLHPWIAKAMYQAVRLRGQSAYDGRPEPVEEAPPP